METLGIIVIAVLAILFVLWIISKAMDNNDDQNDSMWPFV